MPRGVHARDEAEDQRQPHAVRKRAGLMREPRVIEDAALVKALSTRATSRTR